ncbi:MAG: hypothetical protein DI539_05155 [Flavobacterium psychrophilum]|nr:MAG: hypothetical protein DI539_05155 [Flavobacterium psychrophilum]
MRLKHIVFGGLAALIMISAQSCIDNNNRDNKESQGRNRESDYRQDAPTYNKTRDDTEENMDTVSTETRIPKDTVEIKSKGNASSK